MTNLNSDYKEYKTLSSWDFPNTKGLPDGYDTTQIPEATPENMVIMMNKINELTTAINSLMKIMTLPQIR